jgi:hypothetical protein
MRCKIAGCVNLLFNGRTYECSKCSSEILADAQYFYRPLSELLENLEDVTLNSHPNSNQKPTCPSPSSSGND